MAARPAPYVDPDAGIPDLIRRLADDSKRLARDEVRLAKLETGESMRSGGRGVMVLLLAFGAGVVALVGLTIMLAALIGRWTGHYWMGTLIVAAVELVAALLLVRRGLGALREPPPAFAESKDELRETVDWARTVRANGAG